MKRPPGLPKVASRRDSTSQHCQSPRHAGRPHGFSNSTMGVLLLVVGAMGVVAAIVALNRAPDRSAQFHPSRDLSEAVADPDIYFASHSQA